MKNLVWVSAMLVSGTLASILGPSLVQEADDALWTAEFSVEKVELSSIGRNPYFILEPGYQLVFEDDEDRLLITVLDETRIVDGVETRVVEERESEDGELAEVSRNFFAISQRTNSVFYFGEEVDDYEDGKVKSHSGAWLAGEKGARFGLLMPGQVLLKGRYYQEIAPGVAMDRAEIIAMNEVVETPAARFEHCLKTEETNPLKPREKEHKYYAPGVGLLADGSLKLVRYGKIGAAK